MYDFDEPILNISDFIFLNISILIAKNITDSYLTVSEQSYNELKPFILYSNLVWFLLIQIFDSYSMKRFETADKILSRSLKLVGSFILIILMDIYILHPIKISNYFSLIYTSILFSLVMFTRFTGVYILKKLRKKGQNIKRVIIVGLDENTIKLTNTLNNELSFGYKILGFFCDEKKINNENSSHRIIGGINLIQSFCLENSIDEVYISTKNYSPKDTKKIINFCDSNFIRLKIIPSFQEYTLNRRININFYSEIPILHLRKEPLENQFNKLQKRIFDLFFSTIVILTIIPWLFPIVYIIQKLSDKGPVFFIQKRSGQDNIVFNCFKFRTMSESSDNNKVGTLKNDPRITRFGKILRKTRVDELPQFFNVFIGQMSVVGPRPHMISHTKEYAELVDQFLVRQFVKPGITGWAQTTGYIDESKKLREMQDKVKKDVWYIENWTFLLDLKIIVLTILNIFKKDKNAY